MIPGLNESLIRQHASEKSIERGANYVKMDAVKQVVRRGNMVLASIEGSGYRPYTVRIRFDPNEPPQAPLNARCNCPYDWGGWCKHIVATLMICLYAPDVVEERPDVQELLADLDRETLILLFERLAERKPRVIRWIEKQKRRL